MFQPLKHFPRPAPDLQPFLRQLPHGGSRLPALGLDYEWDVRTMRPTLAGFSDGVRMASIPFTRPLLPDMKLLVERADQLVGHNLVGAELPILRKHGIRVPLAKVEDTIIRWWLTNAHLCKAATKVDDKDDPKGRGFMGLWTMLSVYTNWWNYKECRGASCEGPCPEHQPRWYNSLDSLGPILALPGLKRHSAMRGVDHLYPLHVKLADYLVDIRERGINVDVPYVARLRKEFEADKARIWDESNPHCQLASKFNPESPKQVLLYFKERGVELDNNQEATVRKEWEHTHDADLRLLLDWKELGDGADRWFAPRRWDTKKKEWRGYVDEHSIIHGHLSYFTSSGRLQMTSPNMQNVAKRRVDRSTGDKIGMRVRRAVIPPPDCYWLRADYKSAENVTMLHHAGYRNIPDTDFHAWMVRLMGLKETDEFSIKMGGAREAAKSVTHSSDYLEGLALVEPAALHRPGIAREVAAGARLVFPDWKFRGKVVTLTGINLAKRAFGEASYANRKRGLDAVAKYFAAFPKLRDLQKRIASQVERDLAVRPPNGYYTLSYADSDESCMKIAASIWGSQACAHFTKLAMLRCRDDGRMKVSLQIHDELLYAVEKRVPPALAAKWAREYMCFEVKELKGLVLRIDTSHGENWADTKPVQ